MVGSHVVRAAGTPDVEALLAMAAARREQYRAYQPQFWRPAEDAIARQRAFFESLLHDDAVAVLVVADEQRDIQGFVVARTVSAPPVYDPGGSTCMVDDLTVRDDEQWSGIGRALLEAVAQWGAARGAGQIVVVTAHLDDAKRRLLAAFDLSVASEWWVGSLSRPGG